MIWLSNSPSGGIVVVHTIGLGLSGISYQPTGFVHFLVGVFNWSLYQW